MHDKAQAVAPQVHYELKMLRETYKFHSHTSLPERGMKSALLESFLLHARNLHQFLTRRRADLKRFEEGDVLAEDYFDVPTEWTVPKTLNFLDNNWTRLNRSLAHLTYDRIDYQQSKNWVLMDTVVRELTQAWDTFIARLPESRRNWFS